MNRGFDEFYGFMGRGAHPYFDHSDMEHPIYRGLEPTEEDIKSVTRDETRDILMAMIKHLDLGVGEIVSSLKKHGFFVWDQGFRTASQIPDLRPGSFR